MAFVIDALGAWLIEQVASSLTRRVGDRLLGSAQDRALRQVGSAAIQRTAALLAPNDAEQMALVLGEVFQAQIPSGQADNGTVGRSGTLLEGLCAGMAARLAVLGDPSLTGTWVSSAQELGVPVELLTQTLIAQVLEQIRVQALEGGPLEPLVRQLNDDATHLQLRDQARLGLRSADALEQLVEQVRSLSQQAQRTPPSPPAALRAQRVRDCDPRGLGVHPSITLTSSDQPVEGVLPDLPLYVPRDAESQVRDAVLTAAGRGGLVLLTGDSSVGKTRLAYQALLAELPGWWLYHPADAGELAGTVADRQLPRDGWVVWLDEFQDFLIGGLTLSTVRALLDPSQPMVLLATMWPAWYERFATSHSRVAAESAESADPYRDARRILATTLAVIRLGDFTADERQRTKQLAVRDPRLGAALADPDFGPTQVLSGAPQLLQRWEHASDPYGKAVLTAAIDARRLGHLGPLPAELLRDAAPGYLSGPQRATADPATWFSSALAYATQQLRGATAALIPVAGPGMGTITGYTVADYLLQNAQVVRRHIPPPASFWDAVVAQTTNAVHRITLAHDAKERGLYWYVVALLAPAAEVGDINGMLRLASWLDWTGHSEEAGGWWHCAAQTGNPDAMWALAEWLEWTGRGEEAEEWRRRVAETGDTNPLRRTLGEARKDREEAENRLCRAAETGDLQSLGHLSGWRRRAAREGWEDPYRFWEAFRLWRKNGGSVEDVHLFWRRQAEAGDPKAMRGLATSLERMGRSEEAEEWRLRVATRTGGAEDMWAYAGWLDSVGRGEEADEWRRRTGESGDPAIMWMLAWWLQRVGRGDEAEYWWRRAAEAGEYNAMWALTWWLERVGRGDEAARLRRYGIEPGGSTASPWTAPNAMPMS